MIRGIVCDMDDTLYDEREYVRSGFSVVARVVGHSDQQTADLAAWLWAAFEAGIRGDTFDLLRAAFPDAGDRFSTGDLVDIYRTHVPSITLAPGVPETLDRLHRLGQRLGVLSDGPVASQAAKATALSLKRWFDPILLTGSFGPTFAKPGTAGFEAIALGWGIQAEELAYIADNPQKDFVGPRKLGWRTIRILHPRQLHYGLEPVDDDHRADIVIDSPADLLRVLPGLSDRQIMTL